MTSRTRLRTASAVAASTLSAAVVLMTAAPALAMSEGIDPGDELSVAQTIGLFVLLPLALFGVIALAVLGPSIGKGARHRTGAGLDSGPVWVGAPGTTDTPSGTPACTADSGERGGASARW